MSIWLHQIAIAIANDQEVTQWPQKPALNFCWKWKCSILYIVLYGLFNLRYNIKNFKFYLFSV